MNLQILSAGLGTRLRPVTNKIPKPALPLLNVPMLFYSYHYFKDHPFKNIIINTFHLGKELKTTISKFNSKFTFVSDGDAVLGTGGGIENAKDLLTGDGFFWVINGDSVFLTDEDFVLPAEKNHRIKNPIATLVVTEHPDVGTKFGGVWVDNENRVLSIGKNKPDAAIKGYHFTGFRILSEEVFKYLPNGVSELFDALNEAIRNGHEVHIHKISGEFFETGNIKDYLDCTKTLLGYLKNKKYSKFLDSLLKTYSPHSRLNDLSTDLKLAPHDDLNYLFVSENFKIFNDTELVGFVVADKNVEIKEKCRIKNSVILENQTISENTEIEENIIF